MSVLIFDACVGVPEDRDTAYRFRSCIGAPKSDLVLDA
jgi:hypothetical protein